MARDQQIAQSIAELSDEERAELSRICAARQQRAGRGGQEDVIHYETGVPDHIAASLKSKGLFIVVLGEQLERRILSTTIIWRMVSNPAYTKSVSERVALDDSSVRTVAQI
jgi:hypothetical protein